MTSFGNKIIYILEKINWIIGSIISFFLLLIFFTYTFVLYYFLVTNTLQYEKQRNITKWCVSTKPMIQPSQSHRCKEEIEYLKKDLKLFGSKIEDIQIETNKDVKLLNDKDKKFNKILWKNSEDNIDIMSKLYTKYSLKESVNPYSYFFNKFILKFKHDYKKYKESKEE